MRTYIMFMRPSAVVLLDIVTNDIVPSTKDTYRKDSIYELPQRRNIIRHDPIIPTSTDVCSYTEYSEYGQ